MTDRKQLFEAPRSTRRRLIPVAVGIVILVIGVLVSRQFGLYSEGANAQPAAAEGGAAPGGMPPMPVDVDTARRSTVTSEVRATGRVEALNTVELKPDESGRVVELLFREGQPVDSGTPLLRIDAALLRAQAERATADRDLARQQLERVRRLRADNAAAPADVERVEAAARAADAALRVLQLQIERTTVRAPFAGVVGQRFVSVGDYVTSSNRLLALHTMDPQRAVVEVPERYADELRVGQQIAFTVAAQTGRTFHAQVEFIDPVVQPESRTIVVKARAPNPGHLLRSGMFIEARLAIATRAGAVVVSEDAVQPLRTTNVVWAVADGKASRRQVQLGVRSAGTVEVLSGVKPGELVVVGGLERMNDGMAVAPRPRASVGKP
ncbi:MAG: efflux RND transporter periplasmic adaptor subunit [Gemmatimonadetes bacterium]|nr:efflux RND transporter periplasmic adaptor subunit [Gemmatimonadota bacterium]